MVNEPTDEVWKYFYKGTRNYKTNHYHKEAWCRLCIHRQAQRILSEELDQAAGSGPAARSEQDIEQSCAYLDLFSFVMPC